MRLASPDRAPGRIAPVPCARVMGSGWQLGRTRARRSDPSRDRKLALGLFLLDRIIGRGRRRCCHEAMMGRGAPWPGRARTSAVAKRGSKRFTRCLPRSRSASMHASMHVCLRGSNQAVIIRVICAAGLASGQSRMHALPLRPRPATVGTYSTRHGPADLTR